MTLNLSGIQTASLYGFPTALIKWLIGSPQKCKKESSMSSGEPHTSRGKRMHACAGMHATEAVRTGARRSVPDRTDRQTRRQTRTKAHRYLPVIHLAVAYYLPIISIYLPTYLSSIIHLSNYPFIYVSINLFIHHLFINHLSTYPSIQQQLYGYTHSHIHRGTYPPSSRMSCILKGPSVTRTTYRITSMCHWHEPDRRRHP